MAEGGALCAYVWSEASPLVPCLVPTVAVPSRLPSVLQRSGLGSVKAAERSSCLESKWRRGHSSKTPSGSNSEGRGRRRKAALLFL